ncbi:hypothetical protein ATCC90586_010011 [Pythium insidiosum]|nr:hypothetical protein ATCC90586_010011 [Pythium insidiosum]
MAKTQPEEEHVIAAIATALDENPEFGVKRMASFLKEKNPEWSLGEKRVTKLLKKVRSERLGSSNNEEEDAGENVKSSSSVASDNQVEEAAPAVPLGQDYVANPWNLSPVEEVVSEPVVVAPQENQAHEETKPVEAIVAEASEKVEVEPIVKEAVAVESAVVEATVAVEPAVVETVETVAVAEKFNSVESVAVEQEVTETLTQKTVENVETTEVVVEKVETVTEEVVEKIETVEVVEKVETATEEVVEKIETAEKEVVEKIETTEVVVENVETVEVVEEIETTTEKTVETIETAQEEVKEKVVPQQGFVVDVQSEVVHVVEHAAPVQTELPQAGFVVTEEVAVESASVLLEPKTDAVLENHTEIVAEKTVDSSIPQQGFVTEAVVEVAAEKEVIIEQAFTSTTSEKVEEPEAKPTEESAEAPKNTVESYQNASVAPKNSTRSRTTMDRDVEAKSECGCTIFHGGHDHSHDHDHTHEVDDPSGDSLFPYIDTSKLRALNAAEPEHVAHPFKPWHERSDRTRFLSSNEDDPELIIFIPVRKFQGVSSLTLFVEDSIGGDDTKVYYIGLKGESKKWRHGVVEAVYESRPQAADHKVKENVGPTQLS